MLATFVIGLREGLEAALIVGIVAAFLRQNGRGLAPMWAGVGLALLLSAGVGVALKLIEQALPQAQQEMLETLISLLAVVFVTGMIAWMHRHARTLRRDIEAQAAAALGRASTLALALMAFFAVLREGFESAVFLLATFSAAQSSALAATGAVLGLLIAVLVGWGIYVGGVRLNLGRFFRVTAAFLILVAAGLVVSTLRTAHGAGWLEAGQLPVANLAWLIAPGTVRAALVTGVLGIPADPRLIEVIGWLAYLLPMTLYVYWPQRHRPSALGVARLQAGCGLGLAVLAAALVMLPAPAPGRVEALALVSGGAPAGEARLLADADPPELLVRRPGAEPETVPLPGERARPTQQQGLPARLWQVERRAPEPLAPAQLSLQQVTALAGGRIPVGFSPQTSPGPFDVTWQSRRVLRAVVAQGMLLDAAERVSAIATLRGGGLVVARVLSVSGPVPGIAPAWQVAASERDRAATALGDLAASAAEHRFWALQLPLLLGVGALVLFLLAWRNRARLSGPGAPGRPASSPGAPAAASGGDFHAVH